MACLQRINTRKLDVLASPAQHKIHHQIVHCDPRSSPTHLFFVTSRRLLKAAEAIREVVAASILTELRDPRVQDVTVVGVKVSPDMREADRKSVV